jgi:hypothetical protein
VRRKEKMRRFAPVRTFLVGEVEVYPAAGHESASRPRAQNFREKGVSPFRSEYWVQGSPLPRKLETREGFQFRFLALPLLTIQLCDLTFEDAPGQMVSSNGRVVLRKYFERR